MLKILHSHVNTRSRSQTIFDHQVLLRYVIQRSLANTTPVFTDSADQAMDYLNSCVNNELTPPGWSCWTCIYPKLNMGGSFCGM